METRRLTFPAPSRCWIPTPNGWASRPWTAADVLNAQSAGAWFKPGSAHEFADRQATQAAFGRLLEI